jgi:hypothetical protein
VAIAEKIGPVYRQLNIADNLSPEFCTMNQKEISAYHHAKVSGHHLI